MTYPVWESRGWQGGMFSSTLAIIQAQLKSCLISGADGNFENAREFPEHVIETPDLRNLSLLLLLAL